MAVGFMFKESDTFTGKSLEKTMHFRVSRGILRKKIIFRRQFGTAGAFSIRVATPIGRSD
jgi:hypothetical protein